jgi:hypothetical protein
MFNFLKTFNLNKVTGQIKSVFTFLTQKNAFKNSLNTPTIIIIILIDLFLIFNIFSGLNNVNAVLGNQSTIYPCAEEIRRVRSQDLSTNQKIKELLSRKDTNTTWQPYGGYTGFYETDSYCKSFDQIIGKIYNNQDINRFYQEITTNELANNQDKNQIETLRSQYNSTLLENIAGQDSSKSINQATSSDTKSKIEALEQNINKRDQDIKVNYEKISQNPNIKDYLAYSSNSEYEKFVQRLDQYNFWYPIFTFLLQIAYLLPIIAITYLLNLLFIKKGWQILSVITWNIFLLSFIPILLRILEFLQIGILFTLLFELIAALSQGLIFVVSYFYIILIPLIGYLFILILQKTIFNQKLIRRDRIAKCRCINCNFKLRTNDIFCPKCGFNQYRTCANCKSQTFIGLDYCSHCGTKQAN